MNSDSMHHQSTGVVPFSVDHNQAPTSSVTPASPESPHTVNLQKPDEGEWLSIQMSARSLFDNYISMMMQLSSYFRALTHGELVVLLDLYRNPEGRSAVELAHFASVTRPRITQIVDILVGKGYALREADSSDGRKVKVTITDEGRQVIDKQKNAQLALFESFLCLMGDDGHEFVRLFDKVTHIIKNYNLHEHHSQTLA